MTATGGKTIGVVNERSYCVKVANWRSGIGSRGKPSKARPVKARVNCRARSARKLKKITESPAPTRARESPGRR